MSALLLYVDDTHVVAEMRLVPSDQSRTVLGDDPQVTRTILDLRRNLVYFQFLTFGTYVSWGTVSLSAVRWNYSFNT